jgi:uncharacterized protein YyaL (SSP411 family)
MENILNMSDSVYLLQHKDDEVKWQIWSKETLVLAEKQNKPLFISIGYSSCHWCHVMAKESFNDIEIADILNNFFIPVKIDREEFPELDKYYQSFLQATKQQGGWPLSVFTFPDGSPFYGGTYFPKESNYNLPNFKSILLKILEYYRENQDRLKSTYNAFMKFNNAIKEIKYTKEDLYKLDKENILDIFRDRLDYENGGLIGNTKFPNIPVILFLLENYYDIEDIKSFLIKTGKQLCYSGIFDHINGGFFRYTVDNKWNIPHFEKMLYDNAQNTLFLIRLYEKSGNFEFLQFARRTLDFLISEFNDEYGMYASMDADSFNNENKLEEGFYYRIFNSDIDILTEKESSIFAKEALFNNSHLRFDISIDFKRYFKFIPVFDKISNNTDKLKPFKDTKVIASWNMLICYTMLEYSEVANDEYYYDLGIKLYHKLRTFLIAEGKVFRINYNGKVFNHRTFEDSSYYLFLLTKLYELTKEKQFLKFASELIEKILSDFYEDGILYLDTEKQIMDTFDDAIFSAFGLFVYSALFFNNYIDVNLPEKLLDFATDRIVKFTIGHPTLLLGLI